MNSRGIWEIRRTCGLLDEHLNYVSHIISGNTEPEEMQLDLLMPIREVSYHRKNLGRYRKSEQIITKTVKIAKPILYVLR